MSSPARCAVALALAAMVAAVAAAQDAPAAQPMGAELLQRAQALRAEEAALEQSIASKSAEVAELEKRRQDVAWSGVLLLGRLARLGLLQVPWIIVWSVFLLLMYRRVLGTGWEARRRLLWRLCLAFVILGIATFAVGVASADQRVPPADIAETVKLLDAYATAEPWEKALMALEDPKNREVVLSSQVRGLILAGCPVLELADEPVPAALRDVVIASIYWAKGHRSEALAALDAAMSAGTPARNVLAGKAAIQLAVASRSDERTRKLLDELIPRLGPQELAWTALAVRSCCIEQSMAALEKARESIRDPRAAIAVASALRELARGEEATTLLAARVELSTAAEGMTLFLDYAREAGLPSLEQAVVASNVEVRRDRRSLMDLAASLRERGLDAGAKRAVEKAIQFERGQDALVELASTAVRWGHIDVAERALKKVTDTYGFEGAVARFPDPLLLPASVEKPTDDDPSIGIAIGILAEKRGDIAGARRYYHDALNLELHNSMTSGAYPRGVNYTSFHYAYRFAQATADSHLLHALESVGRTLEQVELARLSTEKRDRLQAELARAEKRTRELTHEIRVLRFKQVASVVFMLLATVFWLAWVAVVVFAHLVMVHRMLEWVRPLDHARTLGGVVKFVELEGFFLLASVTLALPALVLLVLGQLGEIALLAEAHLFRLSEWRRAAFGVPKIPLTYRDPA